MTTLHIGRHRVQTLTASDGSAPTGVAAVCNFPANVGVVVNPDNTVTLTGIIASTVSVTYSAPNYQPVSQSITVAPLPTLIVTDGPEV